MPEKLNPVPGMRVRIVFTGSWMWDKSFACTCWGQVFLVGDTGTIVGVSREGFRIDNTPSILIRFDRYGDFVGDLEVGSAFYEALEEVKE